MGMLAWVRRGTGWVGQEEGRVISSCKDSKKIDEVNTIRGHYLIYLCK